MFFEKNGQLFIGRFPELYNGPVLHGFSTRKGGFSAAPYDSLNVGEKTDDDPDAVEKNRQTYFQELGIMPDALALPEQVHGDRIVYADLPGVHKETDGLITDVPGVILSVLVADCLPVFLYDPVNPAVGLIHAGWRGTCLNIVRMAVIKMQNVLGCRPENIQAWIGPSIGPCCYEVGEDVLAEFPESCARGRHLDLWKCNLLQLQSVGLKPESIQFSGLCTCCHPELFYSHRGSGGRAGRMMAVIGCY